MVDFTLGKISASAALLDELKLAWKDRYSWAFEYEVTNADGATETKSILFDDDGNPVEPTGAQWRAIARKLLIRQWKRDVERYRNSQPAAVGAGDFTESD